MAKTKPVKEELENIFSRSLKIIYSHIYKFNPHKYGIDVDDLLQEIKIKLWKILEDEKKIKNYSSYIKRITNSIVIDQIRRTRRYERTVNKEKQEVLLNQNQSHSTIGINEIIGQSIDSLIDSRREVIRLHLLGLDVYEIAALLDCSETQIKNLLYRGINDLKKILKEKGIEYEDQSN